MASDHPLKTYREKHSPRLSRAELAEMLGVKRATVYRWENGRRINEDFVPLVAEKTGIPPRVLRPDLVELIGGDE